MFTEIPLTIYEWAGCVHVATQRMLASREQGLNHATTYVRTILTRLEEETVGVCGERAYCKLFGLYWNGAVNTFHQQPDVDNGIEVRSTKLSLGRLIVRDNDADDRCYVLMTGPHLSEAISDPVMRYHGWIIGWEAKQSHWLDNPNVLRPSWFVPQDALRF